jgi:branched-chain amino acid aminotransferase
MKDIYFNDGRYVPEDECLISVNDLVVLRGYGVFDFLVTYNGCPFHLEEHVMRLENSARHVRLKLNYSLDEIMEIVAQTVRRNPHHQESMIRIIHTGGISANGVTPEGNGILLVMVSPKNHWPAEWYRDGAKVVTNRIERVLPDAKSTNYLSAVYAMEAAHAQGAIESIYVDRNQRVLEGTTSNIFFFKNGRLITGDQDILPGVTRKVVLELLQDRFELDLRDVQMEEIKAMDEVFITSSTKEVVPIVQVDRATVGSGRPGPLTRKVMEIFHGYTAQYGQGTA